MSFQEREYIDHELAVFPHIILLLLLGICSGCLNWSGVHWPNKLYKPRNYVLIFCQLEQFDRPLIYIKSYMLLNNTASSSTSTILALSVVIL